MWLFLGGDGGKGGSPCIVADESDASAVASVLGAGRVRAAVLCPWPVVAFSSSVLESEELSESLLSGSGVFLACFSVFVSSSLESCSELSDSEDDEEEEEDEEDDADDELEDEDAEESRLARLVDLWSLELFDESSDEDSLNFRFEPFATGLLGTSDSLSELSLSEDEDEDEALLELSEPSRPVLSAISTSESDSSEDELLLSSSSSLPSVLSESDSSLFCSCVFINPSNISSSCGRFLVTSSP